jgi:hypothetical protein
LAVSADSKELTGWEVEEFDVEESKKALGSAIPAFSQRSAEVVEMAGDAFRSRGQDRQKRAGKDEFGTRLLRLNWMCLGGHGEIQSSALAQLLVVIITHFASNVQGIWRICGCRVPEEFLPVLSERGKRIEGGGRVFPVRRAFLEST